MAGKKTRKCQLCGIDDTLVDDMEFELVGKNNLKKFYHDSCFIEHKKKQEYINQELKELDDLRLSIQEIYGVDPLPHQAYPLLQNLRMGNQVLGKKQQMGKRYREGYSYPLIQETFEYCSDTIGYWNGIKNFEGFMQAFTYAIAIIIDKIYIVEQRAKSRESREIQMEKHLENISDDAQTFETSYKKPSKKKNNVTDIFDDE